MSERNSAIHQINPLNHQLFIAFGCRAATPRSRLLGCRLELFFVDLKEIQQRMIQRSCNLLQRSERRILMGQLNGAHVAALQAGLECQIFLSNSGLNPKALGAIASLFGHFQNKKRPTDADRIQSFGCVFQRWWTSSSATWTLLVQSTWTADRPKNTQSRWPIALRCP